MSKLILGLIQFFGGLFVGMVGFFTFGQMPAGFIILPATAVYSGFWNGEWSTAFLMLLLGVGSGLLLWAGWRICKQGVKLLGEYDQDRESQRSNGA